MIKRFRFASLSTNFHVPGIKKFVVTLLCVFSTVSFQRSEKDSILIISFRTYVHGEPLQLNKKYNNPFGETFEISRFRFYVGKILPMYVEAVPKGNGSSSYHLIDFSDSSATQVELPVSAGEFNGIEFELGIDSLDQNQGAQSGELDPVKGMFWTWNSGYQSFKIEGSSPFSSQPAHMIAYHIGGYRFPYSTVWKLKINTTDDQVYSITKENKIVVEIPIELDYFFDGQNPIHIKEISACTTPGELARKISENFIGSFNGLTLTRHP